jgi:hypothetical protein
LLSKRWTTALAALLLAVAGECAFAPAAKAQITFTTLTNEEWIWLIGYYGNLTYVGNGSLQYQYSRDGYTFNLCSRYGTWTLQEALWVRDAIDQLPDAYLHNVQATGTQTLYRDGDTPISPLSFIQSIFSPGHYIAVSVPPWPWNYVAFANGTFRDAQETYFTLTHEFGHCAQWNEVGWAILFGSNFTWISWTGIMEPFGLKSWNHFFRDYSRTNHREDYADTCAWYWLSPWTLLANCPDKFWYMYYNVFGWQWSPPTAQRTLYPEGWLYPEFDSMTGNEGHVADFNAVYGQRFMGPFDGGFNTVWYGGSTATHVPISESTIWSWVPDCGTGWVPMYVQTQDGYSNGQWFLSDGKPWWMFW